MISSGPETNAIILRRIASIPVDELADRRTDMLRARTVEAREAVERGRTDDAERRHAPCRPSAVVPSGRIRTIYRMLSSAADPADGLAQFAADHLRTAIVVVGQAISDPALVLDIASEAIALAHRVATDRSGDAARATLDAVENVFRATLVSGRVPERERRRGRDPTPTTLGPEALAGIVRYSRENRPAPDSPAGQTAGVLARDCPSAADLRQIAGSGLVRTDTRPRRRPAAGESGGDAGT